VDAVSQILSVRARDSQGLGSTLGASVLAHVVLLAVVVLMPATWFGDVEQAPEVVMTISLGGPIGPRDGGMTVRGARPVQELAEAKRAIEPVRPPAAAAPEMIEPKKNAPKKSEAKITDTARTPASRTPTKGDEVRKGTAVSAENSARGQGFGLSSGGGGTGSFLDTANFCCPEYIAMMVESVRSNWDYRQRDSGTALVKFTITRDGSLTAVQLEKSSGYQTLDYLATRALQATRKIQPLPQAFTEPSLTVHLVFEYQRQ